VADLPWQGFPVRLQLHSRKFFCENGDCPRAIFTERLPSVVAAYGRRTLRLQEVLHQLGGALGGQAGARMARRLGMALSPDQLLRSLRRVSNPPRQGPRVLGVDEWAWKRGSRYGTILCDLEKRRVVDLLPDSHAQSFARWLETHPGVEVVSRDRAGAYAEGASQGAPQAVQVADRWHLLRNLREALQRVVEREQAQLGRAAQSVAESRVATASSLSTSVEEKQDQGQAPRRLTRAQQQRRDRRWLRYSEALRLHEQGLSQVAIARELSLSVRTLRRWSHAGRFPEWDQPRG
jgi:transposase